MSPRGRIKMNGNMESIPGMILPGDNRKDLKVRASSHYKYVYLDNCDVCGTCRTFNINNFKCEHYNACGVAFHRLYDKELYDEKRSIAITNPEFFRCSFWEDNHYYA